MGLKIYTKNLLRKHLLFQQVFYLGKPVIPAVGREAEAA